MALRDQVIVAEQLPVRLAGLPGWAGGTGGIRKTYEITYDAAIRAIDEIGQAAIELEHRPDIDLRFSSVTIFLTTHTAGDTVTELDLHTARRLDEILSGYGAAPA
jgi:4a-hydroxytetrahydrobiopterin dehydratase